VISLFVTDFKISLKCCLKMAGILDAFLQFFSSIHMCALQLHKHHQETWFANLLILLMWIQLLSFSVEKKFWAVR